MTCKCGGKGYFDIQVSNEEGRFEKWERRPCKCAVKKAFKEKQKNSEVTQLINTAKLLSKLPKPR